MRKFETVEFYHRLIWELQRSLRNIKYNSFRRQLKMVFVPHAQKHVCNESIKTGLFHFEWKKKRWFARRMQTWIELPSSWHMHAMQDSFGNDGKSMETEYFVLKRSTHENRSNACKIFQWTMQFFWNNKMQTKRSYLSKSQTLFK